METSVVVITGANNGIGLHIARSLVGAGHRVAALDLAGENLDTLPPDRLLFCRCDITSDEEVRRAVSAVVARWGRIDILVNNACRAVFGPFANRSLPDLQAELDVNYFGAIRLIMAVLPHMRARGKGLIHNVSSGVGMTGFHSLSGYTAAKGAIEALSRTLDLELAPHGIRVTVMHPPLTNTRSASPLGLPAQAMADPAVVGRRLAAQIHSAGPVIVPDFATALYLYVARRFPGPVGRLFTRLARKGAGQPT